MMTHTESAQHVPTTRALRKVVVVSRDPEQEVLKTVIDARDYDIVFVASAAHAYSQIKRVRPNLVIVCLSIDDLDGFHVLSMLKLDLDTFRIPVTTCMSSSYEPCGDASAAGDEDLPDHMLAIPMN
jgi:CheY-like chemotaxis protein